MIKIFQELFMIRTGNKDLFAKSLLCIVLCLMQIVSFAAPTDSTKKRTPKITPIVKYFNEDAFIKTNPINELQKIDTLLDGIEIFNPAFRNSYKYLGNLGTASSPNLFGIRNKLGTDFGFHNYDLYFISPDSIKYYRTNKPFTELAFELGSKSEGFIHVTHTQNISEQFNFGLNYNRIGSDGYLFHHNANLTNFDFFTWYNSKNQRYNILATGIWNTVKNQENGGLKSDTTSTSGGLNDVAPSATYIYLLNANTTYKNRVLYLKQFYDFGYNYDVNVNDSTTVKKFKPTQRISHSISYETNSYVFADSLETTNFYKNFFYDTAHTFDSTHYSKLENKISWGTLENKNHGEDSIRVFLYQFDISHELIYYHQQNIDSALHNGIAGGTIKLNDAKSFVASGKYCFYGANKGNYSSVIRAGRNYLNKSHLYFEIAFNSVAPSFMQNRYDGNNYSWTNQFSPTHSQIGTVSFFSNKFKTKMDLRVINLNNYIYYDSTAIPQQGTDLIRIFQVDLTKNFVWNHLHFNNRIIYQKVINSDHIRLPEIVTCNSLFYDVFLFKHALQTQFGTDFHYNSVYYSDAYTPVTGQFYLQDKNRIGNYPLLDVYVNFRIRTARIFVRGENILNTFHPTNAYYLVPNYSMPIFCLKFGIIWQFFD